MEKVKSKKQSFMAGVFTIMVAQVLVKLLGFVYRHVLTVIPEFGDEGNGIYGIGFNIYMLLLTVTTVGVPGAISKLVSGKVARGQIKEAKRIFRVALGLFSIVGIIGTLIMIVCAKPMASLAGNDSASGVLLALAPSVIFVSIAAVIRGYFNGMYNMKPSSFNQTLEQIFKAGLTILFVYGIHYIYTNQAELALEYGINKDTITAIMAVWANIASTISCAIGLAYLFIYYQLHKNDINELKDGDQDPITNEDEIVNAQGSIRRIVKMILSLSIPMSLASIVSAINRNIDSFTVNNILQQVLPIMNPEKFANNSSLIVAEATRLYGILAGKVDMLIGLPLSINIAFATALVPAVTEAIAKDDKALASKRISYSIRLSMIIALPCSLGLCVLAKPVLELLFHGQVATSPESVLLLQISSFTILFTVMNQTINASLQGIGRMFIPACALCVGVIIKLLLNLILIRIPAINVYGAAVGSVVCHFIATLIVTHVLRKSIKLETNFKDVVLKPLLSVLLMAGITSGFYALMINIIGYESRIITIASLGVAVITYALAIVILKVLSKEDYLLLPAGDKIYKILCKLKLAK
ncbi:MAG: polysaccharide biosynthesis protein [Clostridia bacterium]|nr:polysaccharide biosynthesis protein [Clostridia bacterium]